MRDFHKTFNKISIDVSCSIETTKPRYCTREVRVLDISPVFHRDREFTGAHYETEVTNGLLETLTLLKLRGKGCPVNECQKLSELVKMNSKVIPEDDEIIQIY